MKIHPSVSLHGLRVQVLLWIVLPVTLLMIVFSLSGVQSHQNSMRALSIEENSRLVVAYARAVELEVENFRLRNGGTAAEITPEDLELEALLDIHHHHGISTFVLLDHDGNLLFALGNAPSQTELGAWPGISAALRRTSGALFTSISPHSDVIAYAPVGGTDWVMLIREPWHSATDPLIRFEQVMPFILLSAVVVSLLILFFGLRYVVRPLQELGARVSRFGAGDFQSLQAHVGGVKEIEDLRVALNNMAQRVQNYQSALHHYLGAITKAQEEERARLARELHDETVQTLIALGHKAQMVQRKFNRSSPQTESLISELRQMIGDAIEEVRRFSRALRPVFLEELGLLSALEILAQEAGAQFIHDGTIQRLSPEKELVLYRVAQEAMNNALHHAKASHISLHLSSTADDITLTICDDGSGFQVPPNYTVFTQQGHFGLMGMAERALLVKGSLQVISNPGSGTDIILTLPVTG